MNRVPNQPDTSDRFDRALASLRASGTNDEDAEALRARIMASLHHRDRRRTTAIVFLIPLAAVLVGSTAWGAGTGRIQSVWRALTVRMSHGDPPPIRENVRPAGTRAQAERAPVTEPAEVPAASEMPAAREVPPAPPPLAAKPRATGPDARALYRAAHQAHFADLDPARALTAWDAYLTAFPGGTFALEARYNRALCLIRLDRSAEARLALEPFARGDHGAYRRAEAAALLEALPEP